MLIALHRIISRFETLMMVVLMSIATVITMVQVTYRYVFNTTLFWAEEVVIYSIIWMSLVAASMGVALRAHISVDILNSILSPTANRWLSFITSLLGITFSICLAYYGYRLFSTTLARGMLSPALRIPMAWAYLPIWVSALLMAFRYLMMFVETWNTANSDLHKENRPEKENIA